MGTWMRCAGCFDHRQSEAFLQCRVTHIALVAADRVIVTACFFLLAGGARFRLSMVEVGW